MSLIHNEYMTAEEIASRYKVTQRTVYNWLRRGKLKSVREHGMYWVLKTEVLAFTPPRGHYNKRRP